MQSIMVVLNGFVYVVVADFEERQCAVGHDGQERSIDNELHLQCNLQIVSSWVLYFQLLFNII